ncbi:MAG: hypothetical protein J4F48_11805 [Nitrospinae bacterium]|nr:hypothetical protein [Nitrospinota bacterium]
MREDQRLLHGAIDTHIHASPSLFPRVCDHIECARGAASVGMRGVVFKIHHGDTSGRIPIVREVMGDAIEIYGGITLNSLRGGHRHQDGGEDGLDAHHQFAEPPGKTGRPAFSGHEADPGREAQRRGAHHLHRCETHEDTP